MTANQIDSLFHGLDYFLFPPPPLQQTIKPKQPNKNYKSRQWRPVRNPSTVPKNCRVIKFVITISVKDFHIDGSKNIKTAVF